MTPDRIVLVASRGTPVFLGDHLVRNPLAPPRAWKLSSRPATVTISRLVGADRYVWPSDVEGAVAFLDGQQTALVALSDEPLSRPLDARLWITHDAVYARSLRHQDRRGRYYLGREIAPVDRAKLLVSADRSRVILERAWLPVIAERLDAVVEDDPTPPKAQR